MIEALGCFRRSLPQCGTAFLVFTLFFGACACAIVQRSWYFVAPLQTKELAPDAAAADAVDSAAEERVAVHSGAATLEQRVVLNANMLRQVARRRRRRPRCCSRLPTALSGGADAEVATL